MMQSKCVIPTPVILMKIRISPQAAVCPRALSFASIEKDH
jgi:hypothetical protein